MTGLAYNQIKTGIVGREENLLEKAERSRIESSLKLNPTSRAEWGQFFTPAPVARLMTAMIEPGRERIRLLDAGAGTGILIAAFVAAVLDWKTKPREISVTAFEIDRHLIPYLEKTSALCQNECRKAGIEFSIQIKNEDFVAAGVEMISARLFDFEKKKFDLAILNPPYGKIKSDSNLNRLLRARRIEVPNLYAAFLALTAELLIPDGELIAITPRSFCNGTYFKRFRKTFLEKMNFKQFHVFNSRSEAFGDDDVLQENIIFRAVKNKTQGEKIIISTGDNPQDDSVVFREIESSKLVDPQDENFFIHLVGDGMSEQVAECMKRFQTTLAELEINVSTGRVVDFRVKDYLKRGTSENVAPLIFPYHLQNGRVSYPTVHAKKPDAIAVVAATENLLVETGVYVLVKRFSAKEERRRVVAAFFDTRSVSEKKIGFENHLNYFHSAGKGIESDLAKGLALYLNSGVVDAYFRQFNGHTQVNAGDLRYLKYPTREQLEDLGRCGGNGTPTQDEIDSLIDEKLLNMTNADNNPITAGKRLEEAVSVLKQLDFPAAQQNERSALTLLALLDLRPSSAWAEAASPLRGVTQMMNFFADVYGKQYKPNTRESVRRQTVHQFLEGGLIVANPDNPERAVNSGKTVYQISPAALELLRSFNTKSWQVELEKYLTGVMTLKEKYAQARKMNRLPVTLPDGKTFTLSAGGQNVLIVKIIEEFCSCFTPGGQVLYIGDADEKWAVYDERKLTELGVGFDSHGKIPDVIVYYEEKDWLVLIEAVTSHGPVNPKRRAELQALFADSSAGLVFVTAFQNRKTMTRYLGEIAWETEVWVADAPTHLIHFNGEKFLGPYEE